MDKILRNAIRTPDGTVLESFYRHDYRTHTDATNGKEYMVDGGREYLRRSANGDEESLDVFMSDPHEKRREAFHWGSYGEDGADSVRFIPLKDLTEEHIQAILRTQKHVRGTYMEELFLAEQEFRRATTV